MSGRYGVTSSRRTSATRPRQFGNYCTSVFVDIDNLLRLFVSEVAVRRNHRRVKLSPDCGNECVDPVEIRPLEPDFISDPRCFD
jgi:hypothetical protein